MEFDAKTVLITGAAGNLGKAVAAAFAAAGASLALLDADHEGLRSAYPGEDRRKLLVSGDLAQPESVASAVQTAFGHFGRIDVLCNLAGGFRMGHPVHETPDEVWRLMLDLNAATVLQMARAVVPKMLAAGSGKIINIAAMAGLAGKADMGAYAASKSAVIRLTEAMAAELREKNINVNCILPSILDTPQNRAAMPQADPRRWVATDALADVVLFLASERARALHGAAIPVVGLS
ncbi:MAG: 3-oxoacyl-ACP reductase [Betaproteobacteria bacterium RIFCSPLOWO2_12_FULL_62_13b]|nr:MAG: 3-oxoacyl-ACP reductase [Betaproteobacteria bacterium RIFCSPLOWO2_12_FULL_62_13b]